MGKEEWQKQTNTNVWIINKWDDCSSKLGNKHNSFVDHLTCSAQSCSIIRQLRWIHVFPHKQLPRSTWHCVTTACACPRGHVHSTHMPASLHRNRVWKFGKVKRKPTPLTLLTFVLALPCFPLQPQQCQHSTALEVREQPGSQTRLWFRLCWRSVRFYTQRSPNPIPSPFFKLEFTAYSHPAAFFFSPQRKLRTALSPSYKAFGALTGGATPG